MFAGGARACAPIPRPIRLCISTHDSHHSASAAEPTGAYAHARRVGNLLFLAGIGPRRRGSKEIPGVVLHPDRLGCELPHRGEIRSCFENVRIVLEESGSSWDKIIDVTVFLTDMKRDFAKAKAGAVGRVLPGGRLAELAGAHHD